MKPLLLLSLIALFILSSFSLLDNLDSIKVTDPLNKKKTISCGLQGAQLQDNSHNHKQHLAFIGNPQKNRYDIPSSYTSMNIKDLIASDADKNKFTAGKAASVTGFVLNVYPGGVESCNCKTKDVKFKDTHIEITPNSKDTAAKYRMFVEVTPRLRAEITNEDWSTAALKKRLLGKTVTFSGLLFYDEEHEDASFAIKPHNAHDWRASCWEIHPVTAIK